MLGNVLFFSFREETFSYDCLELRLVSRTQLYAKGKERKTGGMGRRKKDKIEKGSEKAVVKKLGGWQSGGRFVEYIST